MVTVDEYARVRLAHRDGMSVRQLARHFHHSRSKIREILAQPEPKPYKRLRLAPSVLDPFKPTIEAILAADEQAPRKQRHTAARLYRRLRAEYGYSGSYDRVRLYLKGRTRQRREVFIPLDHEPGQRLECDFGHIAVDFPGGRRQVPVLVVTWSWSNCPFAIALPSERTEAILQGMSAAFAFFGCVPRQVWWDNPKTVVPHLLVGRSRQIHQRYQALASHYRFEPLFCLARRPQEKPRVEGRVQFLQQDWATPVPQVNDLAALNVHLHECCLRERQRTQQGQTESIGVRLAREQKAALPLPEPEPAFEACVFRPAKVDKYQTVQFDRNRYSVPRLYAFATVTVKGFVDHIEVVAGAQVVARHTRSYGQHEQILEPLHYLATLGRRPAALDHANVFRDWQLPALFGQVRKSLEQSLGAQAGARQYIRILQLLAEHPLQRVVRAIEWGRRQHGCRSYYHVEAVLGHARSLAEHSEVEASASSASVTSSSSSSTTPSEETAGATVPCTQVIVPPLRQFDELLSVGGTVTGTPREVNDERSQPDARPDGQPAAGQSQPQTTAPAGHAGPVREGSTGGRRGQPDLRAVFAAFDRVGSGRPCCQCLDGTHQAGGFPRAQGFGQLRFHGHAQRV